MPDAPPPLDQIAALRSYADELLLCSAMLLAAFDILNNEAKPPLRLVVAQNDTQKNSKTA